MFNSKLRLTPHEQTWNSLYDNGTKRGVLLRRYSNSVQLSTSQKLATAIFQTSRRSRVFMVTWTGDVAGAKVQIKASTGEDYIVSPAHIPLLSGHGVTSRRSVSTNIAAYPTGTTYALQPPPAWNFQIEPNIVLPGSKQLFFEYSLENPDDSVPTPSSPYLITQVVHTWEFPGYEGSAF